MREVLYTSVRRTAGLVFFLSVVASFSRAETSVFRLAMSPANEVPAITGLNASATATLILHINRDATGNISSGAVDFDVTYQFPGSVTLTGLHIHNARAGVNGAVVISSRMSTFTDADGSGNIFRRTEIVSTDAAGLRALQGVLATPHLYYVNLHSSVYPGGVVRAQLAAEQAVFRVPLSPASEVPPVTELTAAGAAKITFQLTRDSAGTVTSATVDFEVDYKFPGAPGSRRPRCASSFLRGEAAL